MQAIKAVSNTGRSNRHCQTIGQSIGRFLQQKIWLPKIMYDVVPYFYLTNGLGALWATVYVADWFWFLPVSIISAMACFHLAHRIYSLRRSPKSAISQNAVVDRKSNAACSS